MATIDGAHFFEQLIWLRKRLTQTGEAAQRVHDGFERAIVRCWGSDNPTWREYLDADANRLYESREMPSPSERLRFVFNLTTSELGASEELREWFAAQLVEITDRWRGGVYHPSQPVALIRELRSGGYDMSPETVRAAAEGLRRANYGYAWSQLATLTKLAPEAFDEAAKQELVRDCENWVAQELANPDEIRDTEELHDIRRYAEAMGARVSQQAFEEAYADIDSRGYEGNSEPDDAEPEHTSSSLTFEEEQNAIDALFSRLAPDASTDGPNEEALD